jgi:CBS domain containing-hemolysin-like protein
MTPLRRTAQLPGTATVADFRRLCADCGAAHVLLMGGAAVEGMVSLSTIVNRQLADDQPLSPYADDVLRIEESRSIKSAFYRLRRNPRHSAVVVDARRHPVGFVRLEDIARYIAGK